MKNFTNNFKQFTSRLSARWLIMALMLLVGTSSAWAYNQSAVDLYFDDSEAKWSDNSKSPYVYIGYSSWTACYGPFTRVSGTQYLFKLAKANFNNGGTWNGASAWVICNEKWWDTSGESIDKFTWHGDKNVTQKRTTAWSASYIYKTNGTASTTSDNHTIQAYKTTTVSNSNYTVTINSATGGTLTVKDYDNNAVNNGASKIYLTVLKFSASASSGYTLNEVQINDGSTTTTIAAANLGSTTYTLKSAVTITPVWEKTCTPPAAPTLNPNSTTVCSGTSFNLPSGYRWYTVDKGGTKLASNTISAGVTQKTIYYAEAGEDGCVSITRTAYTVNVDAKPAITLKSAPTICNGTTVTFANYVNTHTGTVTWHTKSDFSDAAITSAKPNATTTYYAKATNGVCSTPATASLKVTVKLTPTKPAITLIPPDGKIVKGENATLTVTAQDDVTFTLYKDGASTGKTETSFTISEEGTYHVVGINSCKVSSPESDKKTITICTPNATLISATYNQETDKIDLSGNLTETCGKSLYYGFLWKVEGDDWNTNNAISGTGGNNNYTSTNNTAFNQSWADAVMGTTYVFTAYALDASSGNPSTYVWYYDETGIEVSKCITITEPNITAAPICTGSTAVLTLNNRQEGVTYTLNDIPIFTDKDTYTTPTLADNTDYTIIATSGSSCTPEQEVPATVTVQVEQIPAAPAITNKATICPNTDTQLSSFNNGVANVMWYSDADCTLPVTTVNISEEKSYYARTQSGICYSEVAQLDLFVYTAPAQPEITPSGTITVGQGKTATITVTNYNANVTYTCYQGLNVVGSWNEGTLSIVAGDALGKTDYRIVASSKQCPNLAEEVSFSINVTESGAKIAQLGNLSLCTNIVTDFVPMYVTNDGIADFADQGATKVKSYTWQWYTNGAWEDCTVNYGANAVGVTNGGADCNNWRANKVGRYRCQITYATDNDVVVGTQESNILVVTESAGNAPAVNAFGDLPIISVNTGSNAFPSDPASGYPSADAENMKKKISVDVKIFDKQGNVHYDRKARMNYRGSSSLNFQKKSYAFVTGKEKTKNTAGDVDTGKANLFGLSNGAKDKDWVLYAANPDPSMMRNRLAFDLYKEMTGKWGVSSMYVELIINNEYKGVYVLMDKITNNEERVNITSNSGFIVKFDKTDVADRVEKDGDQKTFATSRTGTGVNGRYPNGIDSYGTKIDQRFEIEYPEKKDVEKAGGNWTETYTIIKDRFEEFEAALAEKDYPTVRKLIDYDSWADWFILSEYIKNQDTYRASNIFVFNGDKIEAWPLWDQELSFNNQTRTAHDCEYTTGLMATTQSIYEDAFKAVFWLTGGDADDTGGLLGDPCFVALVKSKWEGYKANQLSATKIQAKVDAYHAELGNAQAREEVRWPYTGAKRGLTSKGATTGYYGKNEGKEVGYTSSKDAITSWATGRIGGLTTALNAYSTEDLIFGISPENAPTTPWQPVILTVSVPEGFEYDIAYPELTAAGAIVTKTKDMYQVKIPRPTGDGWTIGGNGTDSNGQATAQTKTFTVTASITKSTENACGSVNKDKVTSTITLNDVTEACNPEIVKQQQ